MKKLFKVLLVVGMLVGLVACGGKKGVTEGSGNVLFTNAGPEEFFEAPWLNPGSFFYNKVLYSRLIVADENLAPIENHDDGLAKSYNYSEDGKTLTFELRDDIKWHDGEPITGEDVKWSIAYSSKTTILNDVFGTTFRAIEGSDSDFSGITVDGNKVVITFAGIAPDALLTFTQFAPLPKHLLKDVDPLQLQQSEFFQKPVGSGPFEVDEVKMNDYTTLKPNENYYNGVANFTVQMSPSPGDSDANLVKNAMSGQLDYAYTKDVSDIKALATTDKVKTTPVDVRYTRLMYVNKFDKKDGSAALLKDPKARQAMMYAIDMDSIGESLFDGTIVSANSLIPGEADKAEGLENYNYNPEKAKEILKEINWDSNKTIDVAYYYNDQVTVDLMTSIQAYLAEVGMKMDFRLVEGDLATILWSSPEDMEKGPSEVEWDMVYAATAALSLHEYYDRYGIDSTINSHTPYDEKLQSLIDATNATTDPVEATAAFKELTKYENEELFVLPLYYMPISLVTSEKLNGALDLNRLGNPQFNWNWDIQNWDLSSK